MTYVKKVGWCSARRCYLRAARAKVSTVLSAWKDTTFSKWSGDVRKSRRFPSSVDVNCLRESEIVASILFQLQEMFSYHIFISGTTLSRAGTWILKLQTHMMEKWREDVHDVVLYRSSYIRLISYCSYVFPSPKVTVRGHWSRVTPRRSHVAASPHVNTSIRRVYSLEYRTRWYLVFSVRSSCECEMRDACESCHVTQIWMIPRDGWMDG